MASGTLPAEIASRRRRTYVRTRERIAVLRVRREHKLHAVQIHGRVTEVARKVHTANPLRVWRNAGGFAEH